MVKGREMTTKMFVNLTVKDLRKSIEFFSKLDFKFNPQFTDETAACMIVGEDIFVMLLTQDKFKTFTPKAICDATKSTEVLVGLSSEGREQVNDMVRKAVAADGTTYNEPQDHRFMYGHGFQDLDGYIWEVFYMEPSARHLASSYLPFTLVDTLNLVRVQMTSHPPVRCQQ
jgi:predicted lactoylglutathione lyase